MVSLFLLYLVVGFGTAFNFVKEAKRIELEPPLKLWEIASAIIFWPVVVFYLWQDNRKK